MPIAFIGRQEVKELREQGWTAVFANRRREDDIALEPAVVRLRWPGDDTDLVGAVERGEFGDEEWLTETN